MKKRCLFFSALLSLTLQGLFAQTNPAITHWVINTTDVMGRHYTTGSATPITDTIHANVQQVRYSTNSVYVNSSGIPSYVIGPYSDGNPSQGTNNNHLFRIPLNPRQNTGTLTTVKNTGQIAVLLNGVPIYNYSDAHTYHNGGIWHQNAIVFENRGFDCAKGHPSPVFAGGPPPGGTLVGGNYHHHQNPSAFNVAAVPMSNICNMYLSDGFYVPDSTKHGPLIGFSFDGFPIYGAYGYANPDGSGGIKRMRSSYQLRAITDRTTLTTGPLSAAQYGPIFDSAALGSYAEDFEFVSGSGDLDIHNGIFTVTPEYPGGIYAYFATIDANGNSAFPYILGSTYYGVVDTGNTAMGPGSGITVSEPVTVYNAPSGIENYNPDALKVNIFPNPSYDVLMVQCTVSQAYNRSVELLDMQGKLVQTQTLFQGSTLCYFDMRTVYSGTYFVRVSDGKNMTTSKIVVSN